MILVFYFSVFFIIRKITIKIAADRGNTGSIGDEGAGEGTYERLNSCTIITPQGRGSPCKFTGVTSTHYVSLGIKSTLSSDVFKRIYHGQAFPDLSNTVAIPDT